MLHAFGEAHCGYPAEHRFGFPDVEPGLAGELLNGGRRGFAAASEQAPDLEVGLCEHQGWEGGQAKGARSPQPLVVMLKELAGTDRPATGEIEGLATGLRAGCGACDATDQIIDVGGAKMTFAACRQQKLVATDEL